MSVPDGVTTSYVYAQTSGTTISTSISKASNKTASGTLSFYSLVGKKAYMYCMQGANVYQFGTYDIEPLTVYKLSVTISASGYVTPTLKDKDNNTLKNLSGSSTYGGSGAFTLYVYVGDYYPSF